MPLKCHFNSSVWSGIRKHMDTIIGNSLWIVGSGDRINAWTNNWLGETLLLLLDIPVTFAPSLYGKVSSFIMKGQWDLPQVLLSFPEVVARIRNTIISVTPLTYQLIRLHSSAGDLLSKQAYAFLNPLAAVLPWANLIWRVSIPPSHSFIFWRLMHDKMPTNENL